MASISGFWSYVHSDDIAESGRITQLAKDVQNKYEMLTGESIELFVDKDTLQWGDDWRESIDDSLANVAFFVPVITPRYFMSEECRKELNFFARRAEKIGFSDLIMPILWTDSEKFKEAEPSDELIALTKKFQWSFWSESKYSDVKSGEYRKAVDELAQRLVEANAIAERTSIPEQIIEQFDDDDSPGELETLASMESSMTEMFGILNNVNDSIVEIGELMRSATTEVNANVNPNAIIATRLRVAKQLAEDMTAPAEKIRSLGNDFASHLNEVDQGVTLVIAKAPQEIAENPENNEQFNDFFDAIKTLLPQAEQGLGAVKEMVEKSEPLEKISRDMRKPLRTMREGLTLLVDGLEVMRGWVSAINKSQ